MTIKTVLKSAELNGGADVSVYIHGAYSSLGVVSSNAEFTLTMKPGDLETVANLINDALKELKNA